MARWSSLGEFTAAVRRAAVDKMLDPRLSVQAAAPGTQSQEAVGADGGYAVPPDMRSMVTQKVLGERSLLRMCDLRRSTSNSVTVPADAQPPWSTSGPQVSIEGEGSTLNHSKLKVESNVLRLNKAQILVPVSDELLEDALGLSVYLEREVGDRLSFRVDDWLINGDGVEKPMGLLNAGARITQTKEGAQSAATIVAANVSKMMGRLPASAIESAVWLAHPETLPQLQALGFPTYAPAGISGGPDPTLLGRPVYYREACAPLGTPGDLILFVPSGYFAAVRTYPNAANDIRSDVSMHCWFDYDLTALRFSMRVAGAPWLAAPFTRYKTSTTVSSVVALEAR